MGGVPVMWMAPSDQKPLVLRYALADAPMLRPQARNCGTIDAFGGVVRAAKLGNDVDEIVATAFSRWANVANIRFVPAAGIDDANIVIASQTQSGGIAFTDLEFDATAGPASHARIIRKAFICLNAGAMWKRGWDGRLTAFNVEHVLTHEIGHALGLDHPSSSGHIMSFRYTETVRHLTDVDIAGAVMLYGAPNTLYNRPTGSLQAGEQSQSRGK